MVFWTNSCGGFYRTISTQEAPVSRNGASYLPEGATLRIVQDVGRKTGFFEILTTKKKSPLVILEKIGLEKSWNGYKLKLFHIHELHIFEAEILDQDGTVLERIYVTKDGGNPVFASRLGVRNKAKIINPL